MVTVKTYLQASTGNVTKACADALDAYCNPGGHNRDDLGVPVTYAKGEYGWFVHVPEDDDGLLYDELLPILALARQHGCNWIEFDCDNEPIEGLSIFHW